MVLILLKIVVLLYISIGFHRASVAFGNTDARVFYNFRFNKSLLIKLPLKWHVFLEYISYTAKYHFRFFFYLRRRPRLRVLDFNFFPVAYHK